jgi:hypothetical protein
MTFEEAVDDIQAMLTTAWSATGHMIFYESVREQREDDNTAWAASVIRHAGGSQRTIGGLGYRQFARTGVLIVQIFTPIGNGLQESYQLAKVVTDAFEGKSSPLGVWFRKVAIREVGKDGMFQQLNVTVEFEYNEVK